MQFLVDAQLPPALARYLSSVGEQASHLVDVGLLYAPDSEIWDFALQHHYIIITKDDDFQFRASVTPLSPSIIWVRVGNCSKQRLIDLFKTHWEAIKQSLLEGATLVEVA